MNNKLYRIVFNKARGLMMAVAECAQSQTKSGSGQTAASDAAPGQKSAWKRCTPIAFAVLVIGGALVSTHAQTVFPIKPLPSANSVIVADPSAASNQRPVVLLDSQGRALVNIQTPSAAGVSRNTYSQFDVGANGVRLNNARGNNPFLAGGEARVILNEVNSSKPSFCKARSPSTANCKTKASSSPHVTSPWPLAPVP